MQSCQPLIAEASPDLQLKMWKIHLWHPRKKAIWKEVFSFNRNETNFKNANYHQKGVWMTLHGHSISQQSISIGNESGAKISKT